MNQGIITAIRTLHEIETEHLNIAKHRAACVGLMNLQNRLTSLVETHLEALQTLRKLKEQLDQDPDAPIDKSALKGALDTLVSEEVVDPFRGPVKIHNWKVRG